MKYKISEVFANNDIETALWILYCVDKYLVKRWAMCCAGDVLKTIPQEDKSKAVEVLRFSSKLFRGTIKLNGKKLQNKSHELAKSIAEIQNRYWETAGTKDGPTSTASRSAMSAVYGTLKINEQDHRVFPSSKSGHIYSLIQNAVSAITSHNGKPWDDNFKDYQNRLLSKFSEDIVIEVLEHNNRTDLIILHKDNKSKYITDHFEIDKEFISNEERNIKDILE